ncbi:MAG: hypothetical protein A2Y82_03445 [Candidatus Buchananbacteria bacterium RBG_13_36_9]|uniref:Uncharacterized protein n=1 Tax=Candidatus Buchananbacteria bacterium RBG_13_36_9 TaxID=1797530 RepID=A0A1G1XLK7_9BACT|nr:MAG: hypothetical protein A2Y82_03445 [Candidatus Buchananbacteria bacterium RBG_13_36_9]
MKHVWSVLCQKSVIDSETNLISLMDCLEEFNLTIDINKGDNQIPNKLTLPINFQIVSYWLIDNIDKKLKIKIVLLDPDNKKINELNGDFELKEKFLRYRTRINIQGLPVTKGGRYLFKIYRIEENEILKEVSELPLDVKIDYKMPSPDSLKEKLK